MVARSGGSQTSSRPTRRRSRFAWTARQPAAGSASRWAAQAARECLNDGRDQLRGGRGQAQQVSLFSGMPCIAVFYLSASLVMTFAAYRKTCVCSERSRATAKRSS
jgi:hypothetical protein